VWFAHPLGRSFPQPAVRYFVSDLLCDWRLEWVLLPCVHYRTHQNISGEMLEMFVDDNKHSENGFRPVKIKANSELLS
jgi:hypothetical protein